MTTAELLHQWFESVWNNASTESIDELLSKNVLIHGLDGTGTTEGPASFHEFYNNFKKNFSEVNVDVSVLTHDENYAAATCTVNARSITGKEISFSGITIARFKNKKVEEFWNSYDFLKMYQQLGHILVEPIEEKENKPIG